MNEEAKALLAAKKEYDNQIDAIKKTMRPIKERIAEICCSFKVGDLVVNNKNEKAKVEAIRFIDSSLSDYHSVFLRKIKKDGSLYKYTSEAYMWDKWKLEKQ